MKIQTYTSNISCKSIFPWSCTYMLVSRTEKNNNNWQTLGLWVFDLWDSHQHQKNCCFRFSIHPIYGSIPEAGMSLIIDHSGRIAKRPTIKDLCANKAVTLQQTLLHKRANMFSWKYHQKKARYIGTFVYHELYKWKYIIVWEFYMAKYLQWILVLPPHSESFGLRWFLRVLRAVLAEESKHHSYPHTLCRKLFLLSTKKTNDFRRVCLQ